MVALAVGDGFHLGETFVRFVAVDRLDDAAAAALFAPGSLPNGQNSFGAITSNAIASFVSFY